MMIYLHKEEESQMKISEKTEVFKTILEDIEKLLTTMQDLVDNQNCHHHINIHKAFIFKRS